MKNFHKMSYYAEYRRFGRIPCPYCFRKTYAGLNYRHAECLSIKKIMARHISKRRLAA